MIELEHADKLVAEFLKATEGMWERIEIAGSVRRRQPKVNDIDFVGIPVITDRAVGMFDEDYDIDYPFGDWVRENADPESPGGVSQTVIRYCRTRGQPVSTQRKIVRFFWQGVGFDVYITDPSAFAILWLIRTGPNRPKGGYGPRDPGAEQNQALAMRAISQGKGLNFTCGIAVKRIGKMLTFDTEEGVFAELGLPFCPPECRDHPAWIARIRSNSREGVGKVWLPVGDKGYLAMWEQYEAEVERETRLAAMTSEERTAEAEEAMVHLFGELSL